MVMEVPYDVQALPCIFLLFSSSVDFIQKATWVFHYIGYLLVPACQVTMLLPCCSLIANVFVVDVYKAFEFGLDFVGFLLLE